MVARQHATASSISTSRAVMPPRRRRTRRAPGTEGRSSRPASLKVPVQWHEPFEFSRCVRRPNKPAVAECPLQHRWTLHAVRCFTGSSNGGSGPFAFHNLPEAMSQ